jgi:hypothetical protein
MAYLVRIGGALPVALALLLAGSLAAEEDKAFPLKPPAPAVALKPPKLEKLEGETCGKCHADVLEEWVSTAHAISWVDEVYRDEIKDKSRPESCHACHVPKPVLAAASGPVDRAQARDQGRDLGISCESCHAGPDGAMLGPWGAPTSAHRSAKSDAMTEKASSAMCAVCHSTNIGPVVGIAKDFVAAKFEEKGKSCIGCHMAPVERKPADGAADGSAPKPGRSHAIQTPRDPSFLALAFEPSLKTAGGKSVVSIQNRAGHRIPGLIGRKIEFQAEVLSADGKKIGQGSLVLDARTYLPVEKSVEVPLSATGASVHLRGLHHDPRQEKPVEFLDVKLEAGGR